MVSWEALDAFSRQLELCQIGPDDRVALVVDNTTSPDRLTIARAALERTGADAVEIRALSGDLRSNAGAATDLLGELLAACDLAIVAGEAIRVDAIDGRRVLYLESLAAHDYPPHINLRRRVRELHNRVTSAGSLVVGDPHGTDLRIELAGAVLDADHGTVDDQTATARYPAGWVAVTTGARSVSGRIVLMPGDANLAGRRLIASPVVLEVIDDHIATIDGDSPDADVLRALLEYPDDPNAYGFGEIAIGLNPGRGPATAFDERLLDPTVSRLTGGLVSLSFGENLVADRPCPQRITLVLPGRDLVADDLPVVVQGRLDGDFAPDVYEL